MKVLIAYDGSESSDAALKDMQRAGLPRQSEAIVMSVADVFLPPPTNDTDEVPPVLPEVRRAIDQAERKLNKARLRASYAAEQLKLLFPEWQIKPEALADSPAWAVVNKVDEWKPDLVVMGAHGHSVLGGRLVLGSVSQRVLYEAICSVRIVRGGDVSPSSPIRILIGVDGSPYADAAVDAVAQRNWPDHTEVRLISVVDNTMVTAPLRHSLSELLGVDEADDVEAVPNLFEASAQKLRAVGLNATTIVRHGKPKDELIEEAKSWNSDSIFVGAKGMRGIKRLLLGSVSAAVAAGALCSVEVVRPGR